MHNDKFSLAAIGNILVLSGPRSTAQLAKEDDDLWGSIAALAPRTVSNLLNVKSSAPTTRAKPLSAGRGRGNKALAPKLGA
ncbi:putative inactive serine/threonine-protein kinase scy1 isoform X1 [Cucumis melo var. makuwa]|uniref:Inactive serine/threonine-protein kinase scy1 isoform X1 n=3 Tax=Cucumis melo TaxID=3656 RepID=A0A5A7T9T0_CUCMM|nr:putative inactive serine/threonine-protein kinase scy1 isoform X1 [Cucumis melo var. makuwa]